MEIFDGEFSVDSLNDLIPYENEQFVPFYIAERLFKAGFNKPCIASFYNNVLKINTGPSFLYWHNQASHEPARCPAPLWQQAFDWFLEKHSLHGHWKYDEVLHYWYAYINDKMIVPFVDGKKRPEYVSAHKAKTDCLEMLIEIIRNNIKWI